ncbi:MAG: hypothetical protein HYS13_22085 [Planctomycetia bacterium]|nr:hypothetical protein [Planctomycetia bacterium]
MNLINWDDVLPDDAGAVVAFSSLSIPDERDEFQHSVAEIRLPQGRVIDVGWEHARAKYVVTLFTDEYENPLEQVECDDPQSVVA